jgi:hypothetical protein
VHAKVVNQFFLGAAEATSQYSVSESPLGY